MGLYTRKRHSHKKHKNGKTLKSNKRSLFPKYLIHATDANLVESIINTGIRTSSNTGKGQYKYNWVPDFTLPKNKSKSNFIKFDKVFTQLVFDDNLTFNVPVISDQHTILILDPKLIEDYCKDNSCIVSAQWIGGKKDKKLSKEYDPNKSLNQNLKKWSKFLGRYEKGLSQNEIVFNKPIDHKYIKCILLLPPQYKYFYAEINNDENFTVTKCIKEECYDYTDLYLDDIYLLLQLEKKYPNIKIAFTWEEADEILSKEN
jgi:hypothetical protein